MCVQLFFLELTTYPCRNLLMLPFKSDSLKDGVDQSGAWQRIYRSWGCQDCLLRVCLLSCTISKLDTILMSLLHSYGPRPKPPPYSPQGTLNLEVKFAPFASDPRRAPLRVRSSSPTVLTPHVGLETNYTLL